MATDRDGDVGGNSGAFNPMTPNVSVDFTGASKGSTPDTSTATLIKAAGTGLENIVEGSMRYVTGRIEEGAQEAVDSIQNIHLGYEDDIARRAGSTDGLTDAYRSGAVSPSYYWMHMDQASRALRAQYPNFRPEIDAAFSKRTGGIPANRLIAELQQSAGDAARAANSQAERERKEIAEIAKDGHLPPDYGAPGTNYDIEYIRARHYAMAGEEARVKANDASLARDEKQGKVDLKKSTAALESELEGSFKFRFEDTTSFLGQDYQAWRQNATEMTQDPSKATPDAVRQAQAAAALRMEQDVADVRARAAKFNTMIPVEDRDRIVNSQIERIKGQYGLLIDGKINILAQTKAHVEYSNLNADANILSKQGAAQLIATRRNYGDPLTEGMFARNPQLWSSAEATMSHGLVSGPIMNDNVPAMTALKNADEAGASSSAKKVGLQQAVAVMTDPNAPANKRADIGKNLFGPDNKNMLESLKPKDRRDAFAFFTGPQVTNYMATKASPEEKQRWLDWTEQSFLALNRTAAQTVGDAARGNDFVNVKYDPTFNRVIVDETADKGSTQGSSGAAEGLSAFANSNQGNMLTRGVASAGAAGVRAYEGVTGGLSRLEQSYFADSAKKAADDINAASTGLANAWRAAGMPEDKIKSNIGIMIHQIGVSEQAKSGNGSKNSFWGSLATSIHGAIGDLIDQHNEYNPRSSDTVTEGTVRAAKNEGRKVNLENFDGGDAKEVRPEAIRAIGPDGTINEVVPDAEALAVDDPFAGLPQYPDGGGTRVTTYSNDTITSDNVYRNDPTIRNGRDAQGQRVRPFDQSSANGAQSQGVSLTDFRNNGPDRLSIPAAIRSNNPGAQYPGPISSKYGATVENLKDGHKIAVFPDAISGAAAQFELLATSSNYAGKSIKQAVSTWSGGNNVKTYLNLIQKETGLAPSTKLTPELLSNPAVAIPLAKAMAKQESGKDYPLDNASWQKAHSMAFPSQIAGLSGNSGVNSTGGTATDQVMQLAKEDQLAIVYGVQKVGLGVDAPGVPNPEPLKGILNEKPTFAELEARINEAVLDPKDRENEEEMEGFNREIGGEFFGLYNKRKDSIIIGLNQAIADSQTMSQQDKDRWVDMLEKIYNAGAAVAEKGRQAKMASQRRQGRYRGGESDATPASIIMNDFIKNVLQRK